MRNLEPRGPGSTRRRLSPSTAQRSGACSGRVFSRTAATARRCRLGFRGGSSWTETERFGQGGPRRGIGRRGSRIVLRQSKLRLVVGDGHTIGRQMALPGLVFLAIDEAYEPIV